MFRLLVAVLCFLLLRGCTSQVAQKLCPRKCSCEQRIAVHCAGVGLLNMPRRLPRGTLQLMAENNNITELPESMLRNGNSLHTLILFGNMIRHISTKNFVSTPFLKYLNLSQNNISFVPANAFSGLLQLQMLSLSDNQITRFSPNAFKDLPSLKELLLSNNKIRALPNKLLSSFGNLIRLTLDENKISTIPDGLLQSLTSLKVLDLSHNSIHRISPHTTSGLCSLETLYLQNNQLEDFDQHMQHKARTCDESVGTKRPEVLHQSKVEGVFTHMKLLRSLDLRFNSLHTLKYSSFSGLTKLQKLKLDGNYWRCSCDLKWTLVKLREQSKNEKLARGQVHCTEPKIIENYPLDHLTFSELEGILPTSWPTTTEGSRDGDQYGGEETIRDGLGPNIGAMHTQTREPNHTDEGTFHDPDKKFIIPTVHNQKTMEPTSGSPNRQFGDDNTREITSESRSNHDNKRDDVRGRNPNGTSPIRGIHSIGDSQTMMNPIDFEETKNGSEQEKQNGEKDINTSTVTTKPAQTWMVALLVIISLLFVVTCMILILQRQRNRSRIVRCCIGKDKLITTDSIRSVTTYPLLYDNPLARRPLPKEPQFVAFSRGHLSEDVRWTNGGVYGLGSNRSSFISIQSSQTNLNCSVRPPLLPPSRQSMILPRPPDRIVTSSRPISYDNRSLYSYGENIPLVTSSACEIRRSSPSKVQTNILRSSSKEKRASARVRFPSDDRLHQPLSERRKTAERRRNNRRSRRPESAIVIPTLQEQDEKSEKGEGTLVRSKSSNAGNSSKRARKARHSHRLSDRKSRDKDEILEVRRQLFLLKQSKTEDDDNVTSRESESYSTNKPIYNALRVLDRVLTLNDEDSLDINKNKLCVKVRSKHANRASGQACNQETNCDDIDNTIPTKDSHDKRENSDPTNNQREREKERKMTKLELSVYNKLNFENSGDSQGSSTSENTEQKSSESDYEVLALCTEKKTSVTEKHTKKETAVKNHTPKLEELKGEKPSSKKTNDPFCRKESIDSLYVDKDSICETISTIGESSCFSECEDDFEMLHPLIDNWDPYLGVFGSDQCILDSLRDQDELVENRRVQTSPASLEQYTVPLSELSSEDDYSVLEVQTVRSRSSSVGSTSTILRKKKQKKEEFLYALAGESEISEPPQLPIAEEDLNDITEGNLAVFPDDSTKHNYQHIKDMYSGFSPEITSSVKKSPQRNTPVNTPTQRKKQRPYAYIQPLENKKESRVPKRVCSDAHKKKKVKREKHFKRDAKSSGYFESKDDESSLSDNASTDVELLDLGTL